jgi:citrate lyase subunit beta/citryl-CoA lyase
LRSVLFVPGDDEKGIRKAAESGADALILDIEEPRTPYTERGRERARRTSGAFLAAEARSSSAPSFFVRVNPAMSGLILGDLQAVVVPGLTGICLPKITRPADVIAADAMLTCFERERGLEPGRVLIYPILETAEALRQAYDIAMASPRCAYMGGAVSRFGDIHQALGYTWTPEGRETLFLRSKVLIDARAARIRYPVSGMWGGDVDALDALRRWARELRELGYYGMMLGHAGHVPLVHEVFTPSKAQIAHWQAIVAAAERASDEQPATFAEARQGEMHVIHIAHVGSARLNLEWAEALGLLA